MHFTTSMYLFRFPNTLFICLRYCYLYVRILVWYSFPAFPPSLVSFRSSATSEVFYERRTELVETRGRQSMIFLLSKVLVDNWLDREIGNSRFAVLRFVWDSLLIFQSSMSQAPSEKSKAKTRIAAILCGSVTHVSSNKRSLAETNIYKGDCFKIHIAMLIGVFERARNQLQEGTIQLLVAIVDQD